MDNDGFFRVNSQHEGRVMEWISVEDELPPLGEWTLVMPKNLKYVEKAKMTTPNTWHSAFTQLQGITHWMPLPEPPKD